MRAKRTPSPALVHSSICRSPSEFPNAAIGRRPICIWMPTGLPPLSSLKLNSGTFMRTGLPSRNSKFSLPLLPTICSGGMAIDPLRKDSHEIDAAAGDYEGLEAIAAQIGEQFEHG